MSEIASITVTSQGAPLAPSNAQWEALVALKQQASRPRGGGKPEVDVIVPVYQGFDETMACVFAAVSTTLQQACEVVLINDGSPEPELVEALAQWSRKGLFTLLHNDQNLGFVRTVNRGMALHADRDVVLLNSDAIVYGDWLERLRQAVVSSGNVATVTPFSNNAEICSYPGFVTNNHVPLEVDDGLLDALARACNVECPVSIPTGVGFCMYIRRTCLDEVGYFDAKKFGKGYGEENDFCLRATSKGWLHLLATNVFVRHCGGVSFGEGKTKLVLNGLRVLARDWPDYDRTIQEFIAADPVFPARRALDAARVVEAVKGRRTMLFVTHDWGGGIERHIRHMTDVLRSEGVATLVMRAPRERNGWVSLEHSDMAQLPNLRYCIKEEYGELLAFLRQAGVFHIHVHSFAGYPVDAGEFIVRLASELSVAYDFTAHDYLSICPRITMIDGSGVYCGEPAEDVCVNCVEKNGAPVPVESIPKFRERYREFLQGARRVFAPSADAKARCEKWFPFLDAVERTHPQGYSFSCPPPVRYRGEGILRVAIIGAIGPHKGSSLLLECARYAEQHELPIRFVVFGITNNAELDAHRLVTVKGAYKEGEVGRLLSEHRCHMAFFSSVWPETWSYTLSEALDAGLFPVAFDLGAMAERIKGIGWGECLPVELMTRADLVVDRLLALRADKFTQQVRDRLKVGDRHYPHLIRDYYELAD